MADNQPPDRPADHLPALPAPQRPMGSPPEINAEFRRFQEFQRFQDYQRFVEADAPQGVVTPGTPQHGTASSAPPAHHEIAEQLAGVRQYLADLTTTQARINRTINPPLWRRILRGWLVTLLTWLVIIVIVGSVGVPLLINNLFGNHDTDDPPPRSKEELTTLPEGPHQAVYDVYLLLAHNHPAKACHGFSLAAQIEFANAVGAPDCQAAVTALYRHVTDPATYGNPNLRDLPNPAGSTDTISSCEFAVSGGPRLGAFTMTQYVGGWEIMDYVPPAPCPP